MTDLHATPPGESPPHQPKEPQSPAMERRHDSSVRGAQSWGARAVAVVLAVVILVVVVIAAT